MAFWQDIGTIIVPIFRTRDSRNVSITVLSNTMHHSFCHLLISPLIVFRLFKAWIPMPHPLLTVHWDSFQLPDSFIWRILIDCFIVMKWILLIVGWFWIIFRGKVINECGRIKLPWFLRCIQALRSILLKTFQIHQGHCHCLRTSWSIVTILQWVRSSL